MYVDRYRFAGDPHSIAVAELGKLRTLLRNPRGKAATARHLLRDRDILRRVYGSLKNEASRALFIDLLKYRLLGAQFTRVANNERLYTAVEEVMAADIPSEPLPPALASSLGALMRSWAVEYRGVPLNVVSSKHALYWILYGDQYYYQEGEVAVRPEAGDVVLDGGAFLGEMSIRFAVDVGPSGRVYAFDPFMRHARLATENARRNKLHERLKFFAAGLASNSSVDSIEGLVPDERDSSEEKVNPGRVMSDADARISIDDFCEWYKLEKLDYIKMDIEGAEIDALKGSHQSIMKWRPKLAISVYHRPHELWTIPDLIRREYPFYDLYLGHHTLHAEETVLYAVAKK